MSSLPALRALARVELRAVRRHPARALLVVLLVAVPVAAMVGGGALLETTRPSAEERGASSLGRADLLIELATPEARALALAQLPAGARVDELARGQEPLRVPGRRLGARSYALDAAGLGAGMLQIVAGVAPASAGEVALSPALARALELELGDEVLLEDGAARLCGLVTNPEDIDVPLVLRAASAPAPRSGRALLVDVEDDLLEVTVQALRSQGLSAHSTLR